MDEMETELANVKVNLLIKNKITRKGWKLIVKVKKIFY